MILYCAKVLIFSPHEDLDLLEDSLQLFAALTDNSDDDILDLISNGELITILVKKLGAHVDTLELFRPCLRTICNLSTSNNKFVI